MLKKYKEVIILLGCLVVISRIYLYTMFPAFKNDDSPETITSAYALGISHPPGYPLFTMAGKVFSLLPVGSPAFRVNSFSIFLAMLILFLSCFLIKQNTRFVFGSGNKAISFIGVFILAFSYIFWNQAIEAKGGVYILNLLFMTILIYLSTQLFGKFTIKRLYLMSFVYGLSLANHWPSMIILLPVFGYFFFKYRRNFSRVNIILLIFLFVIGLSPYIYLPLRCGTEGIYVFMVKPDTWVDFWWTILRGAYSDMQPATMDLYKGQVNEFIKLFLNNFSFIWILIFFGGYVLLKKRRKLAFFYISAFLIIILTVLFYNRTPKEYIWAVDIFLMPAEYILLVLAAAGSCFIMELLKNKPYKYLLLFALAGVIFYSGVKSFNINNERYNYLSYDFGANELATMEQGSFYIPLGDYFVLPLSYERVVEHKANDINYVTLYNLSHERGINDFIKKYGRIEMKEHNLTMNTGNIIDKYFPAKNIYFSYDYNEMLKARLKDLRLKEKGLLYKVAPENGDMPYNVFKNYSYRGIFHMKDDYDKALVSLYVNKLAQQASVFYNKEEYARAIEIFKYALLFPENSSRPDICYYLYLIYTALKDEDNRVKYLKEAIKTKKDYYRAYEILGTIYYNDGLMLPAKEMFEKAIKYGSANKDALQMFISRMGNMDVYSECKALSDRASEMTVAGKYLKAMDLLGFLFEHNFATAEVYKNMGICNFKTGNFEEALNYFRKAGDMDKTCEIYLNIAEAYYNMKETGKALNTLKEAMEIFGNDQKLLDLDNKIKQGKGLK